MVEETELGGTGCGEATACCEGSEKEGDRRAEESPQVVQAEVILDQRGDPSYVNIWGISYTPETDMFNLVFGLQHPARLYEGSYVSSSSLLMNGKVFRDMVQSLSIIVLRGIGAER
jgi:hypothetical protein